MDEDRLKRWMSIEIRQTNEATVTRKPYLGDLLAMDDPEATARDGSTHTFQPEALERLADELSPLARAELKLPITIYLSHKTADDCYIADDEAIEALTQLGVVETEPRDGKLWMGTALARRFAKEWPSVAQFLIV